MDGAQNYLNQLSLEERVKFYEQPKSSTSQKPANEIQDKYMEVNADQLDIYGLYISNRYFRIELLILTKGMVQIFKFVTEFQ